MNAHLNRLGTWILLHPRTVSLVAFAAFAVLAVAVVPAVGIARPRWKP